jgi:asparagine synthase (glutamine-hydrolysing)
MCGIFVAFSKRGNILDLNKCRSVLKKLAHRGPDFSFDSIKHGGSLFMGQTVLSITGKPDERLQNYQLSKSKRFNLVLNGEIYNYKQLAAIHLESIAWDTGTDAEVLVNLYEKVEPRRLAKELQGMYAYCVFDSKLNRLYIARDLVGEKCIYMYEDDNVILFASETSTILEYLNEYQLNSDTLHSYFYSRHLLTPHQTLFKGIVALPVGTCFEVNLDTYIKKKIHEETLSDLINVSKYEQLDSMSEEELLEELDAICKKNAKMLAPRTKYASIFSGGIDSSIASWYMLKESTMPPSMLVALQFGDKDVVSKQVGRFEEKLGVPVFSCNISQEEFSSGMRKFYEEYKTMMATHSFVSQMILSNIVKEKGCKVIIGGDGADELFGGYEYYKKFDSFTDFPSENPSPYSGFIDSERCFDGYNKEEYRNFKKIEWDHAIKKFSHVEEKKERTLQAVLYLDSFIEMETVGLRSSDLMSMAGSIEGRSFFVTKGMLEFGINLPIRHKINFHSQNSLFVTKPLLKKSFVKLFGKELLFGKQGYSGYPNESATQIVQGDYSRAAHYLSLSNRDIKQIIADRSTEWKLLNTELFLRAVS